MICCHFYILHILRVIAIGLSVDIVVNCNVAMLALSSFLCKESLSCILMDNIMYQSVHQKSVCTFYTHLSPNSITSICTSLQLVVQFSK